MTFWMSTWIPFGRREQGLFRLEDAASNSNGSNKKAAIAFTAPIPMPVTVTISQDNFKRPEKNAKKSKKSKCELLLFKYIPLAILVFQTAAHVLTVRFASSRPVAVPFLKTAVLFYSEVIKLAVSLLLYFLLTAGSPKKSLSKLYEHFFVQWFDMLKLSVPALAYAIQTVLLYIGLEHLDAGTYSVTYQLKILTTAFFSVLLLKRRLSIVQWMSLFFLLAGVAIVQISADQQAKPKQLPSPSANISALIELKLKANESLLQMGRTMRETAEKQTNATAAAASLVTGGLASAKILPEGIQQQQGRKQNPIIGLASVLAACFLSGFAGVYVEKLLKQSRSTSVWLQNVQLSALAIPISIGFVAAQDGRKVMDAGLGQGFDSVVWAVVLLQSFGGLVTSVVIKYADNILKAFANSFAIIVISLASIFLFQLLPSRLFIAGAALVIGSTLLYALFPYKQPKDGNKKDINGTDEESSENSTQKEEEDEESKDTGIEDVEGGLPVKEDCEEMPPQADTKKY